MKQVTGKDNENNGKLHELLIGHFVQHGIEHEHPDRWTGALDKFPPKPIPKRCSNEIHDELRDYFTNEAYERHVWVAREAAKYLLTHLRLHRKRISKVYWTYSGNDVSYLIKTECKNDPSDLVILTDDGDYLGISIKAHFAGSRASTLSNLSHNVIDTLFNIETQHIFTHHIDVVKNEAWKNKIDLYTCPIKEQENIIINDPYLKSFAKQEKDKALKSVAKTIRNHISPLNGVRIASLFKSSIVRKPPIIPILRLTTSVSKKGILGHEVVDCVKELDHIIDPHSSVMYVPTNFSTRNIRFIGINDTCVGYMQFGTNDKTILSKLEAKVHGFNKSAKLLSSMHRQ